VLRVARQLFEVVGYCDTLVVRQEYWNVRGFVLSGGHPSGHNFGWENWTEEYVGEKIKGMPHRVKAAFNPDPLAYELVTETYNGFGFDKNFIPLFDGNRNFTV
jgi:hypothetical protein